MVDILQVASLLKVVQQLWELQGFVPYLTGFMAISLDLVAFVSGQEGVKDNSRGVMEGYPVSPLIEPTLAISIRLVDLRGHLCGGLGFLRGLPLIEIEVGVERQGVELVLEPRVVGLVSLYLLGDHELRAQDLFQTLRAWIFLRHKAALLLDALSQFTDRR